MSEGEKTGYDINTVLCEMREKYWEALSEVEEAPEEHLECVTFELGGESYAFETPHAAEVIRIPRLVKVPRVQEQITGVFNLRGEITAAIDIRPMLGLPQLPLGKRGRIIIVKGEMFNTGLIVEAVRDVMPLPLAALEPVVQSLSEGQREFIRGQFNMEGVRVMLLDVRKLLASPQIMVTGE
ncbi:chemotaxis protein CheW [Geobacter sp. DSM 9736]|uniref:chemotaxis protein CheW n=1 Tax=Geobacter sp. DSM 9736 TaxID=1277350 RepID=UPI000B50F42C|nr:chemotaxis protein CheW [Geobacter sp. DSM 9736]SNB47682.1 purine-binding chemotaxis protein CheW [Geobacter sp. DSM 9736]